MREVVRNLLSGITTVSDMTAAFEDEERCRRLLEAMVWPRGACVLLVDVGNPLRLLDVMSAVEPAPVFISVRTRNAAISSR